MNSPQNEIYNCLIGPSSGGSSDDDEQYTLTDMPQKLGGKSPSTILRNI